MMLVPSPDAENAPVAIMNYAATVTHIMGSIFDIRAGKHTTVVNSFMVRANQWGFAHGGLWYNTEHDLPAWIFGNFSVMPQPINKQ